MEKVSQLLREDLIDLDLTSEEKTGVLKEMAELISQGEGISNRDEFLNTILQREGLESTGIGRGVAIPHARTDTVKKTVVALGRSAKGVDFASLDGKPAHLIFLIVSPEEEKSLYIKTLAKISRLVRKDDFRKDLFQARTAGEVVALMEKSEG